jgi:cytochrome c-type biogenesis protein CcmH
LSLRPALLALTLLAAVGVQAQETEPSPRPVDVRQVVGAPRGAPLSGPALDRRTAEVSALLRCPVCQGLSVADSPATMAVNMRHQTRDMLAQGYDADQVLDYFEASYGEFVRLQPRLRGVNWIVWLAPLAVLVGGAFLIRRFLGARPAPAAAAPAPEDALPDDPRLAAAVLKVREMAYGWPGGRRP